MSKCGGWPHLHIYDSNDFAKSDQFIIITLDRTCQALIENREAPGRVDSPRCLLTTTVQTTPKVHTCWRPKKLCCKRNPKSLKVFECFVAWMGWAWRKDLTGNWPYLNFEMLLLKDLESQFRCSRFSKSPGWSLWFITSTISTQEGRARISKKSRLNLQQKGLKVLSCKKKWYRT